MVTGIRELTIAGGDGDFRMAYQERFPVN